MWQQLSEVEISQSNSQWHSVTRNLCIVPRDLGRHASGRYLYHSTFKPEIKVSKEAFGEWAIICSTFWNFQLHRQITEQNKPGCLSERSKTWIRTFCTSWQSYAGFAIPPYSVAHRGQFQSAAEDVQVPSIFFRENTEKIFQRKANIARYF